MREKYSTIKKIYDGHEWQKVVNDGDFEKNIWGCEQGIYHLSFAYILEQNEIKS